MSISKAFALRMVQLYQEEADWYRKHKLTSDSIEWCEQKMEEWKSIYNSL